MGSCNVLPMLRSMSCCQVWDLNRQHIEADVATAPQLTERVVSIDSDRSQILLPLCGRLHLVGDSQLAQNTSSAPCSSA